MQRQGTRLEQAQDELIRLLTRLTPDQEPGLHVMLAPQIAELRAEIAEARRPPGSDVSTLAQLHESKDARTIAEMKAEDSYEEGTVTEAKLNEAKTSWGITWSKNDGATYGCGCPVREGHEILPGATIRIYGEGFGSTFHGIDIDGVEFFWRTPWERLTERVRWLAEYDRRKREEFVEKRDELDRQFEMLSAPLKARIARFRAGQADFRVESEPYEAFCCAQADIFVARAMKAEVAGEAEQREVLEWFSDGSFQRELPGWAEVKDTLTPPARWLLWWGKLPHPRQKELMPDLSEEHSGNTFGGSLRLATGILTGASV